MKLSKFFKKSEPTATGIVSGIGEVLAKDDYADKKEWFKFKKKDEESPSPITTTTSSASPKSSESQETSNTKSQQKSSYNDDKTKPNPTG
jgi:hypothetical protein